MTPEQHQRTAPDSQRDEHAGHRNHRAEDGEPSRTVRRPKRQIAWLVGRGTLA
jgi:hypothetical protein